uniref:Uncharacterized protein n=1 Tax=Rhizophora mucronata TaxID=61149 RepID=A0A2P2NK24_RHIMU
MSCKQQCSKNSGDGKITPCDLEITNLSHKNSLCKNMSKAAEGL